MIQYQLTHKKKDIGRWWPDMVEDDKKKDFNTIIEKLNGDTTEEQIQSLLSHHNHTQVEWYKIRNVFKADISELKTKIEEFQDKVEEYIKQVNGKLTDHESSIDDLTDSLKTQKIYQKTTQYQVNELRRDQHELVVQVNDNYKTIDNKLEVNRKERREDIAGLQKEIRDGFAGQRKDENTQVQQNFVKKNSNLNTKLALIGTIITVGGFLFLIWGFFR
jgi:DNA repair exonuclease SbcCD ATPase subunit